MHALSVVFPQGEKFFIDSVVYYRDRIEDPTLKEQVKGFVSQEMQHSAQHAKYNNRIGEEYGHNILAVDKLVYVILYIARALFTHLSQLGVTCALEHFTAIMADLLLNTPQGKRFLSKMPLHHRTLWIWHALEETEHKGVAYDVYLAVGGGPIRRLITYFITSFHFILWLSVIYAYFLIRRGLIFRLSTYKSMTRFFFQEPGLVVRIFPQWLEYLRLDFHPWQHQNAFLIQQYTKDLDLVETGKVH